MKVKFKGTDTEFGANYITEQKIYNQEKEAVGWLMTANLSGDFSSEDIDAVVTNESISEITCIIESAHAQTEITQNITGYNKIISCVIKYADNKTTADIQITKGV